MAGRTCSRHRHHDRCSNLHTCARQGEWVAAGGLGSARRSSSPMWCMANRTFRCVKFTVLTHSSRNSQPRLRNPRFPGCRSHCWLQPWRPICAAIIVSINLMCLFTTCMLVIISRLFTVSLEANGEVTRGGLRIFITINIGFSLIRISAELGRA